MDKDCFQAGRKREKDAKMQIDAKMQQEGFQKIKKIWKNGDRGCLQEATKLEVEKIPEPSNSAPPFLSIWEGNGRPKSIKNQLKMFQNLRFFKKVF